MCLVILIDFTIVSCSSAERGEQDIITISQIGYDPYGKDCHGGIMIQIREASISKDKVGEIVFIQASDARYELPEGLIPSGDNQLKFYGHFTYETCLHLMNRDSQTPRPELFFIYDSVQVKCPYNYFNIEMMKFDSQNCERHPSFHPRVHVLE